MTTEATTTEATTTDDEKADDKPTTLDAIEAGLRAAAGEDITAGDDDDADEGDEDGAGGDDKGDDKADGDEAADGDEGDEDGDGGGDEDEGDEAGADGKKPAKKKQGESEGDEGEGGPDDVNDPIPEEVKGRTRERMERLIDRARDLEDGYTKAQTALQEFSQAIVKTGATPEEFADTMNFIEAKNSQDPKERQKALEYARKLVETIEDDLGIVSGDALEAFPDLKKSVQLGDITEELALELAKARRIEKANGRRQQRQQEQTQETEQQQRARTEAIEDLNELGTTLATTDATYKQRMAALTENNTLATISAKHPPSKWRAEFLKAYRSVKVTPTKAKPDGGNGNGDGRQRVPRGSGDQQPLRGGQPAGDSRRAPTNTLEAIDLGIQEADRRTR